jgi:hypothetical protein
LERDLLGMNEPREEQAEDGESCRKQTEEQDGKIGPEHGRWLAAGDPSAENALVIACDLGGVKAAPVRIAGLRCSRN